MTSNGTTHSTTALRRWSCKEAQLPSAESVKSVHIYDFDNTLFSSPLPNKQLWNIGTCGLLQAQDFLHHGGWWHTPSVLAAVGQGAEIEESRAWEGHWNETIVELVQASMEDDQALNVLLTGRAEAGFQELIKRMIAAKGLDFDIVALKPVVGPTGERYSSTMAFKQAMLKDIILTYPFATEIRIYEDRPKHVKAFRDYFEELNSKFMSSSYKDNPTSRSPITAEVIQVAEQETLMDPTTEVAQVQKLINVHNQSILSNTAPPGSVPYKIKRSVFFTGYLIKQSDTDKLKTLVKLPHNCAEHEIKPLANNILITPRPAPPSILDKVGGLGAKQSWKVTGLGILENRVWAARVAPLEPTKAKIYTENHTPSVVLAIRRQSKPIEATQIRSWQPVSAEHAFEFETTVGEKVLLRIEEETPGEDSYEASFPNAKNARKHPREEDFPALGGAQRKPPARPQGRNTGVWRDKGARADGGIGFAARRGGSRGRGGDFRGGRGGSGGSGRGAAPRGRRAGAYRSLDDNVGQGYGGGSMQY